MYLRSPYRSQNNNDGTFTLEFATSTAATAAEYSGAATLKLCSDSDCKKISNRFRAFYELRHPRHVTCLKLAGG